jgi:hypothetical protein
MVLHQKSPHNSRFGHQQPELPKSVGELQYAVKGPLNRIPLVYCN